MTFDKASDIKSYETMIERTSIGGVKSNPFLLQMASTGGASREGSIKRRHTFYLNNQNNQRPIATNPQNNTTSNINNSHMDTDMKSSVGYIRTNGHGGNSGYNQNGGRLESEILDRNTNGLVRASHDSAVPPDGYSRNSDRTAKQSASGVRSSTGTRKLMRNSFTIGSGTTERKPEVRTRQSIVSTCTPHGAMITDPDSKLIMKDSSTTSEEENNSSFGSFKEVCRGPNPTANSNQPRAESRRSISQNIDDRIKGLLDQSRARPSRTPSGTLQAMVPISERKKQLVDGKQKEESCEGYSTSGRRKAPGRNKSSSLEDVVPLIERKKKLVDRRIEEDCSVEQTIGESRKVPGRSKSNSLEDVVPLSERKKKLVERTLDAERSEEHSKAIGRNKSDSLEDMRRITDRKNELMESIEATKHLHQWNNVGTIEIPSIKSVNLSLPSNTMPKVAYRESKLRHDDKSQIDKCSNRKNVRTYSKVKHANEGIAVSSIESDDDDDDDSSHIESENQNNWPADAQHDIGNYGVSTCNHHHGFVDKTTAVDKEATDPPHNIGTSYSFQEVKSKQCSSENSVRDATRRDDVDDDNDYDCDKHPASTLNCDEEDNDINDAHLQFHQKKGDRHQDKMPQNEARQLDIVSDDDEEEDGLTSDHDNGDVQSHSSSSEDSDDSDVDVTDQSLIISSENGDEESEEEEDDDDDDDDDDDVEPATESESTSLQLDTTTTSSDDDDDDEDDDDSDNEEDVENVDESTNSSDDEEADDDDESNSEDEFINETKTNTKRRTFHADISEDVVDLDHHEFDPDAKVGPVGDVAMCSEIDKARRAILASIGVELEPETNDGYEFDGDAAAQLALAQELLDEYVDPWGDE